MRVLFFIIFLFSALKISANDSISVWTVQMEDAITNQKYTEARKAVDKIINVWKDENKEIDSTYLYLLLYKDICLFAENRYDEAEVLIDKIFNNIDLIDKKKDTKVYSILLMHKAMILEEQGEDVEKLIPMIQKSLEIDTKLYGQRDKRNITTLVTLARYNQELGNYHAAIQYGEECVSISREFLDKYDLNLATYLLRLSSNYYMVGNYLQALEVGQEGANIYKYVFGENDYGYIKALSEIGMCYANLYDYKQALDYCTKSLNLLERSKSENQGLYLNILGSIGVCYSKLGNYEKAINIQQRVIELTASISGTNHLNYATGLDNLSATLCNIGKFDMALQYTTEALEIRKRQKDDIGCVHSLEGFSTIYCGMDKFPVGIKYAKEALALCEKVIGKNHLKYANCLSNLAACYLDSKNYDRALECEEEALKIMQNLYGFNYIDYAGFSLYNLSVIYHYLNNQDKAIEYGMQYLETIKKQRGTQNPAYASTLCAIAECYWYLGDIPQAIVLQEEAKEINEQVFGKDSENYAISIGNLANYYADQRNYNMAIEYVLNALEIKKEL